MKFTLDWLKDHLETTATVTEIAEALVCLGLEVESVTDAAAPLKGFVVGHVVTREKHPQADRLSLCAVDDGSGNLLQIVCGAPNVRQGLKVALAPVGVVIPATGYPLKKGKIRDIESCGMLCSATELQLGHESDGIMELDPSLVAGMDLATALGQTDVIIDVSLTPNRSDCFSVRGLARDLAAFGLGTLKPLKQISISAQEKTPINLALETPHCSYFTGRLIRNVTNGESPLWMQQRLRAVGQKTISALVDITNYICLDVGRPLHVFDADKIKGSLRVTSATDGETFEALNDQTYTLDGSMIAIADDSGTISLAGVMGGKSTACDATTKNVLIESALFDAPTIARTGQSLKIISDARTRFERGVDPAFVDEGLAIATQYILENCGGAACAPVAVGTLETPKIEIKLSAQKLISYAGPQAPTLAEASIFLEKLGCVVVSRSDEISVTPPTWRCDLVQEVDLVEEVLRLKGYHTLEAVSLPLKAPVDTVSALEILRTAAAEQGLQEIYTWSFTDEKSAAHFGTGVPIAVPLTQDMTTLRPSLLIGLLKTIQLNQSRSLTNGCFFEIARVFHDTQTQPFVCAGVRAQKNHDKHWLSSHRSVDVYDVKADVMALLESVGVSAYQMECSPVKGYHPGRCAQLKQGKKIIAQFGEIHPTLLKDFDVQGPIAAFEIFIEDVPPVNKRKIAAYTASAYQPVVRDFAFILDESLLAHKLMETVQKVDKQLIRDIQIFDVYQGDKLPKGKKSIAFQVLLQSADRTLTETDLSEFMEKVTHAVTTTCGGQLRDGQ